ncbi:CREB-binding protein [Caerostris darwini]|uniref:histone acetyltransferase n=1 Tax=Caerostris darwini TaxID=1538125 RepID=A0AAV4S2R3_9ARAC|nr:CREB-binding protein [Caerostris darwini]
MQNSNLPMARTAGEQSTSDEHNAVPCSGSTVNTATAGAIANSTPSRTAVQEKTRLIQLQLALILHAYRCRSNDNESSGESIPCSLPNCATMKHVLSHMKVCKIGKQCTVPHCTSSSQIIAHWKYCTANDCPVCMPLKEAGVRRLQAATGQANQSNQKLGPADIRRAYAKLGLKVSTFNDSLFMNTAVQAGPLMSDQVVHSCSSQKLNDIPAFQPDQQDIQQSPLQMESMLQNNAVSFPNSKAPNVINENFPSKLAAPSADLLSSPHQKNHIQNLTTDNSVPVKDWQLSITMDVRRYLLLKSVQTIFPAVDINTLEDSRMLSLVSYAEKVERGIYKNANSKEEYFHLLAEKLCKTQKELENKRQKEKANRLPKQRRN